MRARLHDPAGPAWTRAVLPSLGALVVILRLKWWVEDGTPLGVGLFAGVALILLAPLLLGRGRPVDVDLEFVPGVIRVKRAGLLAQTIRSRDISAASTVRTDDSSTLALKRTTRPGPPTLLEFPTDEELGEACAALGLGRLGFGALEWPRGTGMIDRIDRVGRIVAGLAWLGFGFAFGALGRAQELGPLLALVTVAALFFARFYATPPTVTLTPEGVLVAGDPQKRIVPYDQIDRVDIEPDAIVLRCSQENVIRVHITTVSHLRRGMTPIEVRYVAGQIRAASIRARSGGTVAERVAEQLAGLKRGDDAHRTWIARLDALALALSGQGYRDAGIDREDLWSAVRDHDCDPEVRGAAARVLCRVDPERGPEAVRSLANAVRDPRHAMRLRLALEDDVDEVARVLERLHDDAHS